MKASELQCGLGFRVFYERVPHELRAIALCHEHRDAQVDAEHVGVVPAGERTERVHVGELQLHSRRWRETVAAKDFFGHALCVCDDDPLSIVS